MSSSNQPRKIVLTEDQTERFKAYKPIYDKIQLLDARAAGPMDFERLVPLAKQVYVNNGWAAPVNVVHARSSSEAAVAACMAAGLIWLEDRDPMDTEEQVVDLVDKVALRAANHVVDWFAFKQPNTEDIRFPGDVPEVDDLRKSYVALTMAACKGIVFTKKPNDWVRRSIQSDRERMLLRAFEAFSTFYHGGHTWSYNHQHLVALKEVVTELDFGDAWPKFLPYKELTETSGPRMSHKQFCIVSDYADEHHTIVVNDVYRNHNPDGPAVKWADGTGIHCINGTRVPPWLTMTPPDQLDPKIALRLTNAAIRDEFVKKVGIDRVMAATDSQVLATECDDAGEVYALVDLNLGESAGDSQSRRYLRMRNPSVGTIHIEGVPNESATIDDALAFRNQLDPDVRDDSEGADWYQQGDVLLKPVGARKYKTRPIVLT